MTDYAWGKYGTIAKLVTGIWNGDIALLSIPVVWAAIAVVAYIVVVKKDWQDHRDETR